MSHHVPVLATEVVEMLAPRPQGCYVDATFGRGGHSRLLLQRLGPGGRLIAGDRDPEAARAALAIEDVRFSFVRTAFSGLAAALDREEVDGVLLDLGVSSPQIDSPGRGFSFRFDGPLDMRMDPEQGMTAAEWLARAREEEIREVIRDYGEERYAKSIAKAIVDTRSRQPVVTTGQLAAVVAQAVRRREPGQDPATRTFQALRIFINGELAELSLALPALFGRLRPGGRMVVISFHSLEDRIVKGFMRDMARGPELPPGLPLMQHQLPRPQARLVGRAVRPAPAEVAANPRARSAVLRVLEKLGQ